MVKREEAKRRFKQCIRLSGSRKLRAMLAGPYIARMIDRLLPGPKRTQRFKFHYSGVPRPAADAYAPPPGVRGSRAAEDAKKERYRARARVRPENVRYAFRAARMLQGPRNRALLGAQRERIEKGGEGPAHNGIFSEPLDTGMRAEGVRGAVPILERACASPRQEGCAPGAPLGRAPTSAISPRNGQQGGDLLGGAARGLPGLYLLHAEGDSEV